MPERCRNTLGRGGSEVHANLNPQVTTVEPTLATLREVLAEIKATDLPDRAYAWDKAAAILATRELTPGLESGWYVQSEREPHIRHWVYQSTTGAVFCSCPDAANRGNPCKHGRAVLLWQRTLARTAALGAVIPFPACTVPDVDAPIPYVLTEAALAALDAPQPQPVA
jgi:hypothetical protein